MRMHYPACLPVGLPCRFLFGPLFVQVSPAHQLLSLDPSMLQVALTRSRTHAHTSTCPLSVQVARAHQLLYVYRAVASLRADEEFQEDGADPAVQAALVDMGQHNNMDK